LPRAAAVRAGAFSQEYDVVALGNLCVDVLLPPAPIPDESSLKTKKTLGELAKTAPARESWELGGNCNFLIAASRLGLRATCAGHVGKDQYGHFLIDELAHEGVDYVELIPDDDQGVRVSALGETLICFVLSDGAGGHAFCSRYDLGPWPLMRDVKDVSNDAREVLRSCRAVFVNGFVFDELKPQAVEQALNLSKSNGAGVFFDPGPRAFTFVDAENPTRMEALDVALTNSDVVLATEEELAALTGVPVNSAPEEYAAAVFAYPGSAVEWVVVKLGPAGATIVTRDGQSARVGCPKVKVGDTVGCGDSSAGAYVLGYLRMRTDRTLDLASVLETTATLATHVGSATAMNIGAGRNVATAETVLDLLEQAANGQTNGVDKNVAVLAQNILRQSLDSAVA
jgi:sugar/nucleoside kinase (ribokinase family)